MSQESSSTSSIRPRAGWRACAPRSGRAVAGVRLALEQRHELPDLDADALDHLDLLRWVLRIRLRDVEPLPLAREHMDEDRALHVADLLEDGEEPADVAV